MGDNPNIRYKYGEHKRLNKSQKWETRYASAKAKKKAWYVHVFHKKSDKTSIRKVMSNMKNPRGVMIEFRAKTDSRKFIPIGASTKKKKIIDIV